MVYAKVIEYCKRNGITISAFEKMCDLSNGTVRGWEKGNPRLETLMKLEEKTKIPVKKWIE